MNGSRSLATARRIDNDRFLRVLGIEEQLGHTINHDKDRKTGVARIWKAVQRLEPGAALPAAQEAPKPERSSKVATTPKKAATPRQSSKKAQVIKMLETADGATLADIRAVTSWQPHSVRGLISGSLVKKMGLKVVRAAACPVLTVRGSASPSCRVISCAYV